MLQDPPVLSSRDEITRLIGFAKKAQIRTLFVQIYRANQAWFRSKVADSHPYEACLKSVSEDPFQLLIQQAHVSGIKVHAWLNMLSLSKNEEAPLLKKYGTEILTKNLKPKKSIGDYRIDDQYFLEPGDLRVREELANMVEEILRGYPDLDGIQFDYIRYPDKNPAYGYTKMNMDRFKKASGRQAIEDGSLIWNDWKRAQVTGFLQALVNKTRSIRPGIQISTTGCVPYSRAYHEAFQDWPSWLRSGLVDFVTLMCYIPTVPEFERYLDDAKIQAGDFFVKVNLAVGAYEMLDKPGTFAEQFRLCEDSGGGACVVFHYGSLLQNPALTEPLNARTANP
ncbi:MAG: family 10 glycosylhydrolase [Candidatus Omnitrophica bacterium]|nr:family 10 glycosylhydrolase [Candidatus Omnitrophota bacterium]